MDVFTDSIQRRVSDFDFVGLFFQILTFRVALIALWVLVCSSSNPKLLAIEIATGTMLGPRYNAERFYIRSPSKTKWQLTYSGSRYRRQARGRLMTLRLNQSLFDNEWFDEKRLDCVSNTKRVIAALDFYKAHGVLAIIANLQAEDISYGEGADEILIECGKDKMSLISAFTADGSLKISWMSRLESLLLATSQRGMVVGLTYFHSAQDEIFNGPEAIVSATNNITDWLVEKNFRNVVINVADEWDLGGGTWNHARFIPENIDRLVEIIRERFNRADYALPIGASSSRKMSYPDSLAHLCDLVLLHGNGRTPSEKLSHLRQIRSTGRVMWMIRDDNGNKKNLSSLSREKASAETLFKEGAGWSYMPWKQTHSPPFNYVPRQTSKFVDGMSESERNGAYFRAVLEHIAQLVLKNPPRSAPGKQDTHRKQ